MQKNSFNEALPGFLDASPTPFHAVENMAGMLHNAGFEKLDEDASWKLEAGGRYYVTRNDSSIIAFTYPRQPPSRYLMVGAHTDSPNLRIKPNPVIAKSGLIQLGVEPYGGLLLNPWFDRDLSIAGRAAYLDGNGSIKEALVDFHKPLAVIPSLAIHLDREANEKRSVNMQTDIVPVIASGEYFDFESMVLDELKREGYDAAKLLSHELSLYDTQKAAFTGLNGEFIASARLDNLLSCYTALIAICSVEEDVPFLMVCNDHEEVGSDSTSGAGGSFLEEVLRRICGDYESYVRMLRGSLLVSADNAHAQHPNFADKHDGNHAPLINHGPVIKINANQRYASSTRTISRFVHAAQKADVAEQQFVARSDMGCGSTIGPITATRLGVETVDVGLPTFAMHSVRELAGCEDAHGLYTILLQLGADYA